MMGRLEAWVLHLSAAILFATGIGVAVAKYLHPYRWFWLYYR